MQPHLFEGRKLVEAARKYGRIVQHGTQQRSESGRAAEIAALHAGKWGKLLVAKGYICKPRPGIGFRQPSPPPKELDFDLWLGPAPKQSYHGNLVHYNWHWFWDFGNGEIGNQGVHQADVAHWAIPAQRCRPRSGAWAAGWDTRTRARRPTCSWPSSSSARCWWCWRSAGWWAANWPAAPIRSPRSRQRVLHDRGHDLRRPVRARQGGEVQNVQVPPARVTPGGPSAASSIACAIASPKP